MKAGSIAGENAGSSKSKSGRYNMAESRTHS